MTVSLLRFRFAVCILSALPLITAAEPVELEPVTVTGSRHAEDARLPVGNLVLDQEELRRMPATNLADALDSIGAVNTRRLFGINGSRASVDLLGFGVTASQNTLLLLNGRRLNDVDMAAVDFSAIPLSAIERIEVIPGSGSVLYGSGASGGAINIVTRDDYDNAALLKASTGGYGRQEGELTASGGAGPLDALASIQALNSDGYRDNNELQQRNAFTDLRYRFGSSTLYLSALADEQNLELPGARTVNPGAGINELGNDRRGTSTPRDWADQKGIAIMPGLVTRVSDQLSLHLDTGVREKEQQFFVEGSFGYSSYTETEIRQANISPWLHWQHQLGGRENTIKAGLDWYDSSYEREASLNEDTRDQPIHDVDIDQELQAVYLQDRLALTQSTFVTLGARHEWVDTRARDQYDPNAPAPPCFSAPCDAEGEPFDIEQEASLWSVGVRHWLQPDFSVFANAERNARFATVDEFFERDPNNNFVSSLDALKPQTGKLYTLGTEWRTQQQHSTLSAWEGHYDNEIHYDPGRGENANLDATKRHGISLNSSWQLDDDLSLTLNGSYQRARFRDGPHEGNEVPVVPRQTGYARLDWQPGGWFSASLSHRYVGKKYFDNDQENDFGQRIPSYDWTNLVLRAEGRHGEFAEFGVYNLQDREAFDYGVSSTFPPSSRTYNAYPLPERHVVMTFGVRL